MSEALLLSMENIHKAFGATKALQGVNLEVLPGQVHILAGENGAGKSTLMKVLTGVYQADEGEIHFLGEPFQASHPKEALQSGIAMIYQEFNLALHLPVHANIFLGHELAAKGVIHFQKQRAATREIFNRLDAEVDPDIPVNQLGVAQRQLVEIARALSVDSKLIVMDEPTAALSDKETKKLFEVIRTLQKEGVGIIYISHYLEEFGEVGDVISVLRDGELVSHAPMSDVTPDLIIQQMVGRKIEDLYPDHEYKPGEVVLTVEDLSSPNGTQQASMEVRTGEIVGVAGLVGAGRTEMLRALFGLDPAEVEALTVQGVMVLPPNPRSLTRQGVGLLSEDRSGEGLAQRLSIADNMTLSVPEKISRYGILSFPRQREIADRLIEQVGIKASSSNQLINQLSGGNQQKVALARLLGADARVLLLDEPTRGIDVGSKAEIYKIITALAEEGKAIVMVSSYLPELFGMCDSLYVMTRGKLSRKYKTGEIDADDVMALATGITEEINFERS